MVGLSVSEKEDASVVKIAPWVVLGGLIGARLYHVVDLWEYYKLDWERIFKVWEGGMSIWGAVAGGGLVYAVYRMKYRVSGAIVLGLPLAQAIGRIANGINGEFTNKVWILPWWSAEAILDIILFLILKRAKPRNRIGIYLMGYGLIRLVLGRWRGDSATPAVVMIVVGSYLLWRQLARD